MRSVELEQRCDRFLALPFFLVAQEGCFRKDLQVSAGSRVFHEVLIFSKTKYVCTCTQPLLYVPSDVSTAQLHFPKVCSQNMGTHFHLSDRSPRSPRSLRSSTSYRIFFVMIYICCLRAVSYRSHPKHSTFFFKSRVKTDRAPGKKYLLRGNVLNRTCG